MFERGSFVSTLFKEPEMNNPAEQIIAASQTHLQAFESAALKAFAAAEKLVELNMAASKAVLGESLGHAKAVLCVKSPQEFMSLQTAFFQPVAEKSAAYFQHVQSIATEGGTDFSKQIETSLAEAKKAFAASVDQLVKNAPAGSEAAVAAFQDAMSQGQKAVETAQANFAVVTKQTSDMVKKTTQAV